MKPYRHVLLSSLASVKREACVDTKRRPKIAMNVTANQSSCRVANKRVCTIRHNARKLGVLRHDNGVIIPFITGPGL